jgi:hypothetical protein
MDGSFPEPSAAFYAAEIATALGNLPSLEVVYRYRPTYRDSGKTPCAQFLINGK